MDINDLSDPERLLVQAYPRGSWVDLGRRSRDDVGHEPGAGSQSGRVIRAEVVRAVLLGAATAEPGCAAGLQLRGAHITGMLDLADINIPCAMVFESCHFDDEIRLAESVTRSVRFVGSRFPSFDGTRMHTDGILDFSDCVISTVVRLDQAKITGQLCLDGATVGSGAVAVSADGLSVDGSVKYTRLTATGAVSMQVSQVTGSIDLTDARITCTGSLALAVGNAQIGGRLIGRAMRVDGEMLLHDTRITRVELAGARLHNPTGAALSAGGLIVSGGMFCTGGFTAVGAIWLVGAQLGANLALRKAKLTNPGKIALNLDRATIGECDGSGLICSGQVSLIFARISSGLNLASAQLDPGPGQAALVADGALIDGTLQSGTTAHARNGGDDNRPGWPARSSHRRTTGESGRDRSPAVWDRGRGRHILP